MACFCDKPVAKLHHSASQMLFRMTPPQIPLQLKLAGAPGLAMDPERADIRLNAIMDNIQTPTVKLGGGPMASLAMTLTTRGMTFRLDDIPALEAQMQQMATSLERNVLPRMSPPRSIPLMPIIRLSMIARLALQIPRLNIDPMRSDADVPASLRAMRPSPPGPTRPASDPPPAAAASDRAVPDRHARLQAAADRPVDFPLSPVHAFRARPPVPAPDFLF